jgi:hypothetical protein
MSHGIYICFFNNEKYLTSATASQASNHGRMDATCARAVRRSSRIHPKLGSNYPKKKTKYGVRTSTIAVVYVCLSPSTAAWPGSVIEDDLVRKSEGQANACKRPCPPGMAAGAGRSPAASRQPATARTPTWRRLYRLVRRGLAPIHPTPTRSGHIVNLSQGKEGGHNSQPHRTAGCAPRVDTLSV